MSKKKICLVCQRYGLEVNGGAELQCRLFAEQLTKFYEVHIATTCAIDYITWKDEYPEGEEELNGVKICRFSVERQRKMDEFAEMSQKIFSGEPISREEEWEWLLAQGPVSRGLVAYIWANYAQFQAVIFFTYLYYPTVVGMPGMPNALLVPEAHDELAISLMLYKKVFHAPRGILFNTEEEKKFVQKKFQIEDIPAEICGIGIDAPSKETLPDVGQQFWIEGNYFLYLGRVDTSKNCDQLIEYFLRYIQETGSKQNLVLAGKINMSIVEHPQIYYLGFVSEEEKYALLAGAQALINASEFESLSMVALESMAMGRPIIVNGKCAVLCAHCQKSGAGLSFNSYEQFKENLDHLSCLTPEYEMMCQKAVEYVGKNYNWQRILEKICYMIEGLGALEGE